MDAIYTLGWAVIGMLVLISWAVNTAKPAPKKEESKKCCCCK